jgi:hypothetical protein
MPLAGASCIVHGLAPPNEFTTEPERGRAKGAVGVHLSDASPTRASTPLDDHNLFWSHLGLILGLERYVRCAAKACPQTTDSDRLQERDPMR